MRGCSCEVDARDDRNSGQGLAVQPSDHGVVVVFCGCGSCGVMRALRASVVAISSGEPDCESVLRGNEP